MNLQDGDFRRRVVRSIGFAALFGVLVTLGATAVRSGDGAGTPPYPSPIPVPNGPYIPPVDSLGDSTEVVS